MNFILIDSKGLSVNTHCLFSEIWAYLKSTGCSRRQLFGGSSGSSLRRWESFQGSDRAEEHRPAWRRALFAIVPCQPILVNCLWLWRNTWERQLEGGTVYCGLWRLFLVGWLHCCGPVVVQNVMSEKAWKSPKAHGTDKLSSSRAPLWTSTCFSFYHFLIVYSAMFLYSSGSGGSPESLATQALYYWAASPSTVRRTVNPY